MKQPNSQERIAEGSDYALHDPKSFPYTTLTQAAKKLKISSIRLSRILRVLQIPVYRVGYLILLEEQTMSAVKKELSQGTIHAGRKKGSVSGQT